MRPFHGKAAHVATSEALVADDLCVMRTIMRIC
jgi:hypothetical protein